MTGVALAAAARRVRAGSSWLPLPYGQAVHLACRNIRFLGGEGEIYRGPRKLARGGGRALVAAESHKCLETRHELNEDCR